MVPARLTGWACGLLALGACGGPAPPSPITPAAPPPTPAVDSVARDPSPRSAALPPVPEARGPLDLRVRYPPPAALVQARDSSFLYGSAGTGAAKVTVNGLPARVWPNGAWLAWVPLPPDSLMRFLVEARTDSAVASVEHIVQRGNYRAPPPPAGVWIDTLSLAPRGMVWWPRDEYLALTARASEGALLRLRLADGTVVPLSPAAAREPVPGSVRGFGTDTAGLSMPIVADRYTGLLRGRAVGPDPGPVFPSAVPPIATPVACAVAACPADSSWAVLEAIRGTDTARARWPLQVALLDTLPRLARMDDDPSGLGTTDSLAVGRALPGGTYHWFFPEGTIAPVSGRANDELRLRLSRTAETWVPLAESVAAEQTVVTPAVVGSITLTPRDDRVSVRIPLTRRIPFRVDEDGRTLRLRFYGAVGDVNWIRHGAADTLVAAVSWAQAAADEVTLTFDLGRVVWGYRAVWERGDLLFEIRRPPRIYGGNPLRDRVIAVDPGHPPGGSTGPTGLREAEANLGVALELRRLLEDAGARVVMTRTEDVPLDLYPRVRLAEAAGAELLVSVHNNAVPDGINPFTSNGTSVFYNHPRSIPLARAIQEELLRRLGLRDLGIGRGDLALVRGTWMPSVLAEGLFMILPDQEAALRSEQGRRLYAMAILDGIRRFLRDRSRGS